MCADGQRADYAPSTQPAVGAVVEFVQPGSPAQTAGLTAGSILQLVEGYELEDIVDWFWLADGFEVDIEWLDDTGEEHQAILQRKAMEDWGIEFSSNVFDGVRTCCNACTFCFMSMLPQGMRSAMYLRDDDYRLSFLQGNFVTLTNMSEHDVERVIEMNMQPLHVSLHALNADARLQLMGRNHQRGLEVLQQLVNAQIQMHFQVVLVPGINDGDVLQEVLDWAIDEPCALSLGIVPLGFTRFQERFSESFNQPAAALRVVEQVHAVQARSRAQNGVTKVHLADEFYINAYGSDVIQNLPPAKHYDDYPQFFDGIGMIRTLVDDWNLLLEQGVKLQNSQQDHKLFVCGRALAPILQQLLATLPKQVQERASILSVENKFFAGNVDVSGLLTAQDVIAATKQWLHKHQNLANYTTVLLPNAMFNSDGLTLDNIGADDVATSISRPVCVLCYSADKIWVELGILE